MNAPRPAYPVLRPIFSSEQVDCYWCGGTGLAVVSPSGPSVGHDCPMCRGTGTYKQGQVRRE